MASHSTGLGKGLGALIRETSEARESSGITALRIDDIVPNTQQPRRTFSENTLQELADSIRSQGVLQPLLVRPLGGAHPGKYEIVAGERRWRASKMAGLTEVPVLIRSLSAQDTMIAALVENLQREDLNPIEEALGLQTLKEEFDLSQEDLAKKIGKSRSAIANSLRLLALPEQLRTLIAEGALTAGHARALLSITDARAQEYLKNLILENNLSVREAEGLAAGWKETGSFDISTISNSEGQNNAAAPERQEVGASAKAPAGRKPQSARILEIQNRITEVLQIPVKVTGKEEKGKISFSYSTKEELAAFVERLCGLALEGAHHIPLEGKSDLALDTVERKAVAGSDKLPVAGRVQTALTGADRQAIAPGATEALESGNAETPGDPADQVPAAAEGEME